MMYEEGRFYISQKSEKYDHESLRLGERAPSQDEAVPSSRLREEVSAKVFTKTIQELHCMLSR